MWAPISGRGQGWREQDELPRGDLPKYDDSDDGGPDDAEDHELEGDDAEDHELEGDGGGYDTDKNKSRGKHHAAVPLDAERVNRSCMLLVSLLLLVAMPFEAWRLSGHPLILVWRLSLLLCSCCGIWTGLLSITVSAQTVFLCIALVLALALYVDAALDPKIGILIGPFELSSRCGYDGLCSR